VDRLTTGRRHARAGSVTVSELLIRQAAPSRCTDSSRTEPKDLLEPPVPTQSTGWFEPAELPERGDDGTDDVDENANATTATIAAVAALPATHRRPQAKGGQLAKLASLGVAGAVLCGAVTISSMIAHQRRETMTPAQRPTLQITGDQALLPDQLGQTAARPPIVPPPPVHPPVATPTVVTDSIAPPRQTTVAPPPTPPAADGGTTPAAHPEIGPASDLDLVREFYENLPQSPTAAFGLLAPELVGTDLGEFLDSWSTVREIETLHVTQRPDGVLATVLMRLRGGGHLRIQQLVTVAESPRRIVGVQLLSAQRN
jgi:hypothetical protein